MAKKVLGLLVLLALAAISGLGGEETDANITNSSLLRYDFYEKTCPDVEKIIYSAMQNIVSQNKNAPAQLLRLLFHDCFIEGCDASVLLNNLNGTETAERKAGPNLTLKGFQFIDMIKEEVEKECPGVVSCSDVLVLAARYGVLLSGGPYYPLFTGRRDSNESFSSKAELEIPGPDENIADTLQLFSLRGFSERETVALLGAHNIGQISCQFIKPRLSNFRRTGLPDSTITTNFLAEMTEKCRESNGTVSNSYPSEAPSPSPSPPESAFGTHYYQNLVHGRGLLYADQQLTATDETAEVVEEYAYDGMAFRNDFAHVLIKLSNLGVRTGLQGEVRLNCSLALGSV